MNVIRRSDERFRLLPRARCPNVADEERFA
jgi:hypothetical protein